MNNLPDWRGYLQQDKSNAAISNICKPAEERWTVRVRYKSAVEAYQMSLEMFEWAKKSGDAVLIANTEDTLKKCKEEKDALGLP